MSADAYKEIVKSIIYKVEQTASDEEMLLALKEGRKPRQFVSAKSAEKQKSLGQHPNPVHGIDLSKVTPTSMFYLPSRCGDNPERSFFTDLNQPEREVLDPDVWLENPVLPPEQDFEQYIKTTSPDTAQSVSGASDNLSQKKIIEEAYRDYRSVQDGTGRHNAFFKAIWAIHFRANIPLNELEPYMARCDYDCHQKDRYAQIIKSLSSGKYGTPRTTNPAISKAS